VNFGKGEHAKSAVETRDSTARVHAT